MATTTTAAAIAAKKTEEVEDEANKSVGLGALAAGGGLVLVLAVLGAVAYVVMGKGDDPHARTIDESR